ncbi:hypothetical protein [Leclercia sp.]|uniref:hypothetical protein n=1 Tax=Leclercia sp. TaxID=1898428 RepID=UPI0028970B14|nr:hypothetical protein [Leclercia sp.]
MLEKKMMWKALGQLARWLVSVGVAFAVGTSGYEDSSLRVLAGVILYIGMEALRIWGANMQQNFKEWVAEIVSTMEAERNDLQRSFDICAKQCEEANEKVSAMNEEIEALNKKLTEYGVAREDIPTWAERIY